MLTARLRHRLRRAEWGPFVWLAIALAGAVGLLLTAWATCPPARCYTPMNLRWVADSLRVDPQFLLTKPRVLFLLVTGGLYRAFGPSPESIFGALVFIHVFNACLLALLARGAGLARWASVFCGLLFLSNRFAYLTLSVEFVVEALWLTALLGVCLGYLRRARARTLVRRLAWFGVEVLCVAAGTMLKESFVIYPAVLGALGLTLLASDKDASVRERLLAVGRRFAPHVVLWTLALVYVVPSLADLEAKQTHVMSFAPWHLLERLVLTASWTIWPTLRDEVASYVLGFALVCALVTFGALAARQRRSPALLFAALLFVLVAAPVLPFEERFEVAYLYQPWAALALVAAGIVSRAKRSTGKSAATVATLAFVVFNFVAETPEYAASFYGDCFMMRNAQNALEREVAEVCAMDEPVWRVPFHTWIPFAGEAWEARVEGHQDDREERISPLELLLRVRCDARRVHLRYLPPASGYAPDTDPAPRPSPGIGPDIGPAPGAH